MKALYKHLQIFAISIGLTLSFNYAYAGKVNADHSTSDQFEELNTDLRSLIETATEPLVWIGFLGSLILFSFKPNVATVLPPIGLGLYGSFGPEITAATFSALLIF